MPKDGLQDLIAKAQTGDTVALERVLLDHYEALHKFIASRFPTQLQSAIGIEDVLQDTLSKVCQRIGQYESQPNASFQAWLNTIAKNTLTDAINAEQAKKRGGPLGRRSLQLDDERAARLLDIFWTDNHTPSKSLTRRESIQAIQIALAALPEDYRDAIRYFHLEGLSLDQVSERMDRSPGAVRGLLQRARKSMNEHLMSASLYLSRK